MYPRGLEERKRLSPDPLCRDSVLGDLEALCELWDTDPGPRLSTAALLGAMSGATAAPGCDKGKKEWTVMPRHLLNQVGGCHLGRTSEMVHHGIHGGPGLGVHFRWWLR